MISSDEEDDPAPAALPAPAAAPAAQPFDWALHDLPAAAPAPDLQLSQGAAGMPPLPQSQQGSTAARDSQPQAGSQAGPSARLGSRPMFEAPFLETQGSQAGGWHAALDQPGSSAQLRAALPGPGRDRRPPNLVARAAEARAAAQPRAAPSSAPAQLALPPQGASQCIDLQELMCPVHEFASAAGRCCK